MENFIKPCLFKNIFQKGFLPEEAFFQETTFKNSNVQDKAGFDVVYLLCGLSSLNRLKVF